MQKLLHVILMTMLMGCTTNISMIHSDQSPGSTDTLEDTQDASPTVSPNINIPLT